MTCVRVTKCWCCCVKHDGCCYYNLQSERLFPFLWQSQQGLKKEGALRHFVVFQQSIYGPALIHIGVMRVQAKVVFVLLYPGVQSTTVASEADGECKVILDRITQQKSTFCFPIQKKLRLMPVHLAPIEWTEIKMYWNTISSIICGKIFTLKFLLQTAHL